MRTATTIEASAEAIEFAVEAEKPGLDICWVAEAWGADAPSTLGYLGYLAARTKTMLPGQRAVGRPARRRAGAGQGDPSVSRARWPDKLSDEMAD